MLLHLGVVECSVNWCGCPLAILQTPTTLVVVWALWPHTGLRTLDVRMTAIVPQAVVTDNRLGMKGCHTVSRLYQATLMSCGTAKHVSVDCIYIYTIYSNTSIISSNILVLPQVILPHPYRLFSILHSTTTFHNTTCCFSLQI